MDSRVSEYQRWHVVRQCLGWEAECDLIALPFVCVPACGTAGSCCPYTELGRLLHVQSQCGASTDTTQLFGILSQSDFSLSILSEAVCCIFLIPPGPGTSRSCYHPGDSYFSQGQVSPAAVLTPLTTLPSPSGKGSVHLAVPAPSILDNCWLCFHCLQRLDCVTLTESHANLLLI